MRRKDAKFKPDEHQTSRQPLPASTQAKSANALEELAPDAFLEAAQSLRRQGFSEKDLAQVLIMKLLVRIDKLFGRIEEAFTGQPFLPGVPPDAKANQLRLSAYATDFAQAAKLLGYAIELSKITSSITTTKPTRTGAEDALKT